MQLMTLVFYLLAAGLVLSAILASIVPYRRLAGLFSGLTVVLSVGLLYLHVSGIAGLSIFSLGALAVYFFLLHSDSEETEEPSNFKTALLPGIILGSFFLILAVILRDADWKLPLTSNIPAGREVLSQYWILLPFSGLSVISLIFWSRGSADGSN